MNRTSDHDGTGAVRHVVVGARGGQGATTVAVVLATFGARRHPTTLVAHDRDAACGILGLVDALPGPVEVAPGLIYADDPETPGHVVVDAGPLTHLQALPVAGPDDGPERRWLVVRGPCYLALRTAVDHPWKPDGVVVVTEPRRALSTEDVARVLDVPVVADIPQDHRVARAVDAGTLAATVTRHAALAGLARLLDPGCAPELDAPGSASRAAAERVSRHLDDLQHHTRPTSGIDPLHR